MASNARGQILKRKYGFLVRVYAGLGADGRRQYENEKVRSHRRKDAQAVLTAMHRKLDMGEMVREPTKMTVNEYLEHWLEAAARPKLTLRTLDDYQGVLRRYVYPTLGKQRLTKLTARDVQALYGKMLKPKDEGGFGVSAKTVINTHQVISGALTQAVKWEMLTANVCLAVDLPKYRKPEMSAMTEDESNSFLEAAEGNRFYVLFALMLGTGLRPGEALALKWQDFDPAKATITVQRALEYVHGKTYFKEPKTPGSRRNVELSEGLVSLLHEHRVSQVFKSDLIFPSEVNTPLNERNVVVRYYEPCLERAGLGERKTLTDEDGVTSEKFIPSFRFYDLRHTHATLLLKDGIHPKIVSERLGHSTITLTMDTYSHVLPGTQDGAAKLLNDMLFKKRTK